MASYTVCNLTPMSVLSLRQEDVLGTHLSSVEPVLALAAITNPRHWVASPRLFSHSPGG